MRRLARIAGGLLMVGSLTTGGAWATPTVSPLLDLAEAVVVRGRRSG